MPFFYRYASWDIICSFALLWFNLGFALFAQTRVFLTWVFVFWVHDWDSHHSLNLLCQVFYEDLGMIFSFFMLVNLWAIFCDVLVMLCLMLKLFASYRVFVSRYFAALCWVQHSYHSYIREVTCCGIFWWFYRSPSLSLSHSSCFLNRFDFTSMIQTDAPAFLWY